jgi:hypothetical protein
MHQEVATLQLREWTQGFQFQHLASGKDLKIAATIRVGGTSREGYRFGKAAAIDLVADAAESLL